MRVSNQHAFPGFDFFSLLCVFSFFFSFLFCVFGSLTSALLSLFFFFFQDTEQSEWKKGSIPISDGLGQNIITICPVAHTNYLLGTYSIAVQAALATSFIVEVIASTQVFC